MSQSPPLANGEHAVSLALDVDSASLGFIEQQYVVYQDNPESLSPEWREYFAKFDEPDELDPRPTRLGPSFKPRSMFHVPAGPAAQSVLQERVGQFIRNVRVRGHIVAEIDPLGRDRPDPPELHPEMYRIESEDYDKAISATNDPSEGTTTFRQVLRKMTNTYTRSIGVQFMHIDSYFVRNWLQDRMEINENRLSLSREGQYRILQRLTDATVFEDFLLNKYRGAKTFSLQGAETLIPLLDLAIERSGDDGINELVIGMAHRGRLNVLANIMGKQPKWILREFNDVDPERYLGRGDVKYHLGFSRDYVTASGKDVHLSLCFNPSHLEYVNTVALGKTRSKQDRIGDRKRQKGLTILIHGDAAFAGEGIVQETLNLSELRGYRTGGTIHIVVNNQIGFTTNAEEGRSGDYATNIAKMLQIPIFHVNGEDPEAVAQVVDLACDFRRKFRRDVVIDMYCYRYHGHNEGDEPAFTQPLMYKEIRSRKSVRQHYLDHLTRLGEITREEADQMKAETTRKLEQAFEDSQASDFEFPDDSRTGVWKHYVGGEEKLEHDVETGIPREMASELTEKINTVPDGFTPHRTLRRVLDKRFAMAEGEEPYDWATAELLAFGSLAVQGHRVRLSGQDCRRGTFSQRHAVIYDFETGKYHQPLLFLSEDQQPVEVINSPLSEAGVLGFEYGYSLDCPSGLIVWEAQFGDFNNAAQVIIDQFITSGEDKWKRFSGVVMMLPHGFEGQGPEHSSARLERFLTMAAEDNIQVVQATTPAQHFHCLRRQVMRKWIKPLIMFTPKGLLRLKEATSPIDEFTTGTFERVLDDPKMTDAADRNRVKRILLCSGRVYYDLSSRREKKERDDLAIVRLEQLYPFPEQQLAEILDRYPSDAPIVWVQDEPENMGAWRYLFCRLGPQYGDHVLRHVSRPESASPATGSKKSHEVEQNRLLKAAFADDLPDR